MKDIKIRKRDTIKVLLLSILTAISCVSCEKVLFMDLPDEDRKIVMNGIIAPGYGLWLNVSSSVGTSEIPVYSYVPINNAQVEYYQDGILISSLVGNGYGDYYETDFKPEAKAEYNIVVIAPGFPRASAVVNIPERVDIMDFDTSSVLKRVDIHNQNYHEIEFFVNFTISDPEEVDNYYMLGAFFSDDCTFYPLAAESADLNMNIYIKDGIDVLAWTDQNTNGQTRQYDVKFKLSRYAGFETDIEIRLYSIEEAYFSYLKTYSQNYTVLNDGSLLYEPVLVSSNVSGGYGILAAVSTSRIGFHYRF